MWNIWQHWRPQWLKYASPKIAFWDSNTENWKLARLASYFAFCHPILGRLLFKASLSMRTRKRKRERDRGAHKLSERMKTLLFQLWFCRNLQAKMLDIIAFELKAVVDGCDEMPSKLDRHKTDCFPPHPNLILNNSIYERCSSQSVYLFQTKCGWNWKRNVIFKGFSHSHHRHTQGEYMEPMFVLPKIMSYFPSNLVKCKKPTIAFRYKTIWVLLIVLPFSYRPTTSFEMERKRNLIASNLCVVASKSKTWLKLEIIISKCWTTSFIHVKWPRFDFFSLKTAMKKRKSIRIKNFRTKENGDSDFMFTHYYLCQQRNFSIGNFMKIYDRRKI